MITYTVEICIQQLGRVEEIVWLPYDAGLSAAAETLVGILKRVIVSPAVYPRFFEFLHVDIQSTGGHCHDLGHNSRMTSCLKDCAQLHSELFRRRHSTLHSHGLFALGKHLFNITIVQVHSNICPTCQRTSESPMQRTMLALSKPLTND